MRKLFPRSLIIASILLVRSVFAEPVCEPCQPYDSACASVQITAENRLDHLCSTDAIGKTLVDTDADGIPDECGDRCPCVKNPHDPDTGFGPCPQPTPEPPKDAAPKIGCKDQKLTGLDTSLWLAFVRPRVFVYFSENDWTDPIASAGAYVSVMTNLDDFACELVDVGGSKSIRLTKDPEVYWRAGFYIDPSLTGDATFLILDSGVDYLPTAKYWSIGGQLQLLTNLQKGVRTGVNLGAGFRIGVLDAITIIPFAQIDFRNDYDFSAGAFLSLDLKMLEELGVPIGRIRDSTGSK